MRYGLATALLASGVVAAMPAAAQDLRQHIDIDARDLGGALAQLSAQTGISIATDGGLPRGGVPRLRGRMTADAALARLLAPMGLEARRVGPRAYRIGRRATQTLPVATPEPPDPVIVVTGRKRAETASDIPGPVAVYRPDADGSRMGAARTTGDVARAIGGMTLTNAGPGGDRLFLRGVADSPLNGFSQSTVSVQLDDARLTFDGPEPGLRLVDVARVEVLKGPQGPLYGTGALGGVYRIVTNRPSLDATEAQAGGGLASVSHGGIGPQAEGVVNLPLVAGRLAVRIVGYAAVDPGWIDDVDGRRDRNRTWTRGGRIAVRAALFGDWMADLSAVQQSVDARDTRYVDRPDAYVRDVPTPEPYAGRTRIYQGSVSGPVGALRLTIATGLTEQGQSQRYHDPRTDAVPSDAAPAVPSAILNTRGYRVFDQEIRLASAPGGAVTWVAGAAFLLARSDGILVGLAEDGDVTRYLAANRRVTETALYADGSVALTNRWRFGLGLRVFRASTRDDRFSFQTLTARAETLFGVTPNLSLSYAAAPDSLVYARFATAFRPGGLDPGNAASRRYGADEVRTFDLGGRTRLLDGRLGLDANLFFTRWRNIQADCLESDGSISTHNAGRATIPGVEGVADWRAGGGWHVEAGATWQRPRRSAAAGNSAYLPLVPDLSARVSLAREMALGDWRLMPRLAVDIAGPTRLGVDTLPDRRMPGRLLGRFGLVAEAGRTTLRLDVDNLLDVRGDAFAFGNPFVARTVRHYTPYRPRGVSLSATRRF
ncbi:TonB-dependent receptor [Sphingomonas sp. CJ20]